MRYYKVIVICLIVFFSLLLTSCANDSANTMRRMMRMVPEAVEVFEQSKEHLDVLRNGGFGERELWTRVSQDNISIVFGTSEGGGSIAYEDWHTLEWLSDEEREALVFLLSSAELSSNFEIITSRRVDVNRRGERVMGLVAAFYTSGGGTRQNAVEIMHGEGVLPINWFGPPRDSYSRYLGDGYTLWVYTVR